MFEHKKIGKLHLLQLRCYGITDRMSDTKHEPGVKPRTKKLDGRMFRYNDSIFSVSAFGNFLSVLICYTAVLKRKNNFCTSEISETGSCSC